MLAEEAIKNDDNGTPRVLFVEQVGGEFLVLRENIYRSFKRRKFFIDRLNASLETIQQQDITDLLDEQNFEIQEVLRQTDRLLFLSTKYNRETKQREFFIQSLDYQSFELGERLPIYRVDVDMNTILKVEFIHSPDQQKILFSIIPEKRVPWIKKMENDYRDLVILNHDLSVQLNIGRLDMRVGKYEFLIEQTLVSNSGLLFFLAEKIKDKKSEEPEYHVLRYKMGVLDSGRLEFTEGKISRGKIDLNPDGSLLFMGYYSEPKRFNAGVGVFTCVVNSESLQPSVFQMELIKNEVMMTGLPDRLKRKWSREIQAGRDLKLNEEIVPLYFFRHPSGDISMIGEIQYVNLESSSFTQSGYFNRFTYNYEHIFITRIKSTGKVMWTAKIPKLYRGSVDLVESFKALAYFEEIHLIFNDNTDNLIINPRKGVRYLSPRSRYNFMVNYKVDAKGQVQNQALFEYSSTPFDKMNMLSLFTDVAMTSYHHLLFSTSGKLGHYYLLLGGNNVQSVE